MQQQIDKLFYCDGEMHPLGGKFYFTITRGKNYKTNCTVYKNDQHLFRITVDKTVRLRVPTLPVPILLACDFDQIIPNFLEMLNYVDPDTTDTNGQSIPAESTTTPLQS